MSQLLLWAKWPVAGGIPSYVPNAELGEQVAIYLRPQRWLSADLGPG
jgi:hypothetical protein